MGNEFFLPELNRICQMVQDRGAYMLKHCCGNINLLMDDLVGFGIRGKNTSKMCSKLTHRADVRGVSFIAAKALGWIQDYAETAQLVNFVRRR